MGLKKSVTSAGAVSTGLSSAEASARLHANGPNELPQARRQPLWSQVLTHLRDPMALLLIAAAAVSGLALGERLDAIAIGIIVMVNAVIAVTQEQRAASALAALERLQTPTARVRRDAALRQIPAAQIVTGDVVVLAAGEQVPADLRLVEAQSLQVDESLLTGESTVVDKRAEPGPDRAPDRIFDQPGWVFSGTLVTRGSAVGVTAATGADTAIGRIAGQLQRTLPPPTPLQRELAMVTRRLGMLAIGIAGGVFVLTLARTGLSGEWLEHAFLSAVALAMAAVPEGLMTVTMVGLAVGVRRMAEKGGIVRQLAAVETLGAATVVVTDKTGTVTLNRMQVEAVAGIDGLLTDPSEMAPDLRDAVIEISALCSDATLDPPTGDPTEIALLGLAGSTAQRLREEYPRVDAANFDATRRRMSTLHGHAGQWRLLTKGAPEEILPRCRLDDEARARLLSTAERSAADGHRLLALARKDRLTKRPDDLAAEEHDLTFVALAALVDPVRQDAAAIITEARAAGVHVIMATGDHPATATAVARQVGLAGPGDTAMTGEQLKTSFPADPLSISIYARVDPEQKLELVKALQRRGEVVAMTGDGVNDAPALQRADIGVALGASGSDVARAAADMVITDDALATIVTAIREGRGIYDNIRKVIDYLVAGNMSEIAVVIGALVLFPQLGVPLLPLQLLWVNLLTDGLPALALGMDRTNPALMRQPPRHQGQHLLGRWRMQQLAGRGLVIATTCLATLPVTLWLWEYPPAHARTVLLSSLVTSHLLYAFVARRATFVTPHRPAGHHANRVAPNVIAAVAAGLVLQAGVVWWAPARTVLGLVSLQASDVLLVSAAAVTALLGVTLVRRLGGYEPVPEGSTIP